MCTEQESLQMKGGDSCRQLFYLPLTLKITCYQHVKGHHFSSLGVMILVLLHPTDYSFAVELLLLKKQIKSHIPTLFFTSSSLRPRTGTLMAESSLP